MDTFTIQPGTVIGNVNVLDITRAADAAVSAIKSIGNVNVLLHSRETARLVPQLNLGNLNVMVEVQDKPRVTIGNLLLSKESLSGDREPLHHVVVGNVLVESAVTASDFERAVASLVVVGQVVYPVTLAASVQAKLVQLVGNAVTYPANGTVFKGGVSIDEGFLANLADNSELVVLGSLRVSGILPSDLVARKIASLDVLGSIRFPEENRADIQPRITNGLERMTVIPAGHVLVENDLLLDNTLLEHLPGSRLYCLAGVQIDPALNADLLDHRLEALVVKELLLCPQALAGVLARKCNLLETQAVFYEGTLWLVDGEERLTPSRFEYLDGSAALVVKGELEIDADLEPRILAERLASVHNYGEITCSTAQRGALEARLAVNAGEITEPAAADKAGNEREIGNVNHLIL